MIINAIGAISAAKTNFGMQRQPLNKTTALMADSFGRYDQSLYDRRDQLKRDIRKLEEEAQKVLERKSRDLNYYLAEKIEKLKKELADLEDRISDEEANDARSSGIIS